MRKLFIDVSPGFYKTKLFNELTKRMDILVVYTTCYDASSRNKDFMKGERNYPFIQLSGSKWAQCREIANILKSENYDEVIVGGYNTLPAWIPIFCSHKKKNALLLESTFRETKTTGIFVLLKRYFFSKLHCVYACGSPHEKLARMFGFKGECKYWNSVGLFNIVPQPPFEERKEVKNFLFVGRLIWQKNLEWLIERFNQHPELCLKIIGFGELETELRSAIKGSNIEMLGAVDNKQLSKYYQEADVFILPSVTETWGLVVEEALNNGTPVLCSHMVGSADDLIIARKTGVVFESNNTNDFEEKLKEIKNIDNYNMMRKRISDMNFKEYEESVINAFV